MQPQLNADSRVLLPANAPTSVQHAARDLARDLRTVFGRGPEPAGLVGPRTSTCSVRVALNAGLCNSPETFIVELTGAEEGAILQVTGADPRGAIYGLYELSRSLLGVDPLWYWTDHVPPSQEVIQIPHGFRLASRPPAFRFRGLFVNDEDLLAGWKPDLSGKTAISLEAWNALFEATLRMGGNLVACGTFPFPDEPQMALASERGLILNQHHQTPLGFVGFRWPEDRVYSPTRDLETLERAWEECVRMHGNAEVVWSLGLRGVNRNDAPFWASDPHAPADPAGRARVIQVALERQMAVVRRVRGERARFITNLWHEGVEMVRSGHLTIPDEVIRVWPDDGYGRIRDGGAIRCGEGVYLHTAYMNGHANQLTEMVPPERIHEELGRALKAGANEFLLLNVSDLRPVPLTTAFAMQIAWHGLDCCSQSTDPVSAFVGCWCRTHFGEPWEEVASILRDYYRSHLRIEGGSITELGDHAYFRLHSQLVQVLAKGSAAATVGEFALRVGPRPMPLSDFLPVLENHASEAAAHFGELLGRARGIADRVARNSAEFYHSHVIVQIGVHKAGCQALAAICDAVRRHWSGDDVRALESVRRSRDAIDHTLALLKSAETGKWDGFYSGDDNGFVHLVGCRALATAALDWLEHGTPLPAPPNRNAAAYEWLQRYQDHRRISLPAHESP